MKETREQFRERLQNLGWDAWEETEGRKGHVDEAVLAAVEAGYAQALQDFRSWLYSQDDLTTLEADLVSEKMIPFTKERGIDLEDQS